LNRQDAKTRRSPIPPLSPFPAKAGTHGAVDPGFRRRGMRFEDEMNLASLRLGGSNLRDRLPSPVKDCSVAIIQHGLSQAAL
jgi:hypothetical protein